MIIDMEQGSGEWLQQRVGACTGSRVGDVLAKRRDGKEAAPRRDYKHELVIERLTGLAYEHYVSPYMEHGTLNEPLARTEYELLSDREVAQVGYAMHPKIAWFGASPDALVGDDGLLEVKCLTTANHLDIILAQEIPDEYKPQMLAEMACAERKWVDFVSFDPRLPKHLQLFVKRFERNDALISGMELEVVQFLSEVESMTEKLSKEHYGKTAANP